MKVRWSQRCAGGCGLWLTVGTVAVRRHRGYWCDACWIGHQLRCETCSESAAVPVGAGAPGQGQLW